MDVVEVVEREMEVPPPPQTRDFEVSRKEFSGHGIITEDYVTCRSGK